VPVADYSSAPWITDVNSNPAGLIGLDDRVALESKKVFVLEILRGICADICSLFSQLADFLFQLFVLPHLSLQKEIGGSRLFLHSAGCEVVQVSILVLGILEILHLDKASIDHGPHQKIGLAEAESETGRKLPLSHFGIVLQQAEDLEDLLALLAIGAFRNRHNDFKSVHAMNADEPTPSTELSQEEKGRKCQRMMRE